MAPCKLVDFLIACTSFLLAQGHEFRNSSSLMCTNAKQNYDRNGPSELTLTGSLKGWTVLDRLQDIEAPTLVYIGSMDEAQDLCVEPFFWKIPRVKWVTIQDASHFTHAEHRDQIIKLIEDFLEGE